MGGGTPPFWFSPQPSPTTVAYAVALAVLAAAVSGVVPGLQTTRRRAPGRLRSAAPGAGGLRLGRLWNGVVAAQVGITVVFTGGAFLMVRQAHRSATVDAAFPADRYLSMELRIDGPTGGEGEDGAPFRRRYAERVAEVASRLAADPAVAAVTLADRLPLTTHPSRALEVEGGAAGAPDGAGVRAAGVRPSTVAPDFFEAFGARVVAGRGFGAADARSDARPVVVDRFFVERFLGGRSAPGRRVRYVDPSDPDEPGPWHTIVGVVEELEIRRAASLSLEGAAEPHVYHPLDPAQAGRSYPLRLAALVPDGPDALAPRVHRIAADVGPDVQIHHLLPLDRARAADAAFWELWAELLAGTSAVALFLSLAGIYAVMSFTVARRTRELGVRVALGAEPPRVVADVFRTPLRYVGVGVVGGCAVVAVGVPWVTHGGATVADVPLLVGGGLALAAVCAAACIVPTLRALRVEPARALSAEG